MHCPYCRHTDSRVLDSRVTEDGSSIRRRRECRECSRRFTTLEQMQLVVVKRSGVIEPFNRDKVISGVRKACRATGFGDPAGAPRPTGGGVSEGLWSGRDPDGRGGSRDPHPLRELDVVAYLRFASVYKHYQSIDDFEAEISRLREAVEAAAATSPPAPEQLF